MRRLLIAFENFIFPEKNHTDLGCQYYRKSPLRMHKSTNFISGISTSMLISRTMSGKQIARHIYFTLLVKITSLAVERFQVEVGNPSFWKILKRLPPSFHGNTLSFITTKFWKSQIEFANLLWLPLVSDQDKRGEGQGD